MMNTQTSHIYQISKKRDYFTNLSKSVKYEHL